MRSIAPALALLLGALGMVATESAAALERADDELRTLRAATSRGKNPAVLALLETAERELGAGRPEQASALLEQALRIEPRNPTVWHYLGLARLELGDTAQANAMAAKSRSLVDGDRGIRDWASRTLIEPARSFVDPRRERETRRLEEARRAQEARRADSRSRAASERDRRNRRNGSNDGPNDRSNDGSNDRARRGTWL